MFTAVHLLKKMKSLTREVSFHHGSAPSYSTYSKAVFCSKKYIPDVKNPLYSPVVCACDFYMFPKLKNVLEIILNREDIQVNVTTLLKELSEKYFWQCIQA
jgi:hypothetical protein